MGCENTNYLAFDNDNYHQTIKNANKKDKNKPVNLPAHFQQTYWIL